VKFPFFIPDLAQKCAKCSLRLLSFLVLAMASANAVANTGKNSSFCVGGGGNSGRSIMQVQNAEIQRRQWIPDERDNFMSWLRGEFAAANAIIDSLCQHLRIVGEPGEYDFVLSSIQQRRCNWTVVLHMQQYFSVAEVLYAIQQVAWRKQQRKSDHSAGTQINPVLNGKDNVYSHLDKHGRVHPGNANFPAQSVKKSGQRVSLTRNGSKDEGFVSGGAYAGKRENADANNEAQMYDALSVNSALQSGQGLDSLSGSATSEFEKTKASSPSELAEKGKQEEETKHECQVQAEPEIGGSIAREKPERSENRGSNPTEKHELEATESKFSSSEQNDTTRKGRRSKAAESNPSRPKAMDGACSTHQSGASEDILANLDFRIVSKQEEDRRRSMIRVSKNFVGNELVEGKMINIVEGLELYENIFDSSELSRLTLLTQKLRAAGRRRELRGQTFVVFKRPMKGHGREMIQFGVPSIDAPLEEEIKTGRLKDLVEPIPTVLQDVINRLLQWQIIPENAKPNSCIINFFNEGDHSQPHISPPHFVRPFWTISLFSECTMVFGRAITINHPGDYKGPLKLSLPSGSLIVMQGNSADVSKYSICSSPGQRVSITFVKVQPKKGSTFSTIPTGMSHSSSLSNSHWPQPASRQSSTNASVPVPRGGVGQMATKHYNMVPTSGVLPVPPVRTSQVNQHLPAPRVQPLFAGPPGPPGAYPSMAVIPPVWSAVPRATPRMPGSGTGVFLPCSGSGSGSGQPVSLLQQQQGVLDIPTGLPINEQSLTLPASTESPGNSCSTSRLSKMAEPNQLAFDSLDKDSERSNAILSSQSFPAKFDFAGPKTAPNKDMVNKSPKSDSNASKMTKGDQWNRASSQSKRSANKLNSTSAGGSS